MILMEVFSIDGRDFRDKNEANPDRIRTIFNCTQLKILQKWFWHDKTLTIYKAKLDRIRTIFNYAQLKTLQKWFWRDETLTIYW